MNNKFNIPIIIYDYNDYIYKYINKNRKDGIYNYIDNKLISETLKSPYTKACRRYIDGHMFGIKLVFYIRKPS